MEGSRLPSRIPAGIAKLPAQGPLCTFSTFKPQRSQKAPPLASRGQPSGSEGETSCTEYGPPRPKEHGPRSGSSHKLPPHLQGGSQDDCKKHKMTSEDSRSSNPVKLKHFQAIADSSDHTKPKTSRPNPSPCKLSKLPQPKSLLSPKKTPPVPEVRKSSLKSQESPSKKKDKHKSKPGHFESDEGKRTGMTMRRTRTGTPVPAVMPPGRCTPMPEPSKHKVQPHMYPVVQGQGDQGPSHCALCVRRLTEYKRQAFYQWMTTSKYTNVAGKV